MDSFFKEISPLAIPNREGKIVNGRPVDLHFQCPWTLPIGSQVTFPPTSPTLSQICLPYSLVTLIHPILKPLKTKITDFISWPTLASVCRPVSLGYLVFVPYEHYPALHSYSTPCTWLPQDFCTCCSFWNTFPPSPPDAIHPPILSPSLSSSWKQMPLVTLIQESLS